MTVQLQKATQCHY